MKAPNLILSLLIPGPTAPEKEIDMYLHPLVGDLGELWNEGVSTYNAPKKETFQLHVTLLWTINDLSAYENLFELSTKGKLACLVCNKDTTLRDGHRMCYMGHRRWLLLAMYGAKKKKRELAYSTNEHRLELEELSRDQLLQQLPHVTGVHFGTESGTKRKRPDVVKLDKK